VWLAVPPCATSGTCRTTTVPSPDAYIRRAEELPPVEAAPQCPTEGWRAPKSEPALPGPVSGTAAASRPAYHQRCSSDRICAATGEDGLTLGPSKADHRTGPQGSAVRHWPAASRPAPAEPLRVARSTRVGFEVEPQATSRHLPQNLERLAERVRESCAQNVVARVELGGRAIGGQAAPDVEERAAVARTSPAAGSGGATVSAIGGSRAGNA